jgi:hypothetical protein
MPHGVALATVMSSEGDVLVMTCRGSAESEASAQLAAALAEIHADAVRRGARKVVLDLRELEFASSLCIKALVGWLMEVQDLDAPHRYTVRARSTRKYGWQARSLRALVAFAGDVFELDVAD